LINSLISSNFISINPSIHQSIAHFMSHISYFIIHTS
jgi:hypothetical protein